MIYGRGDNAKEKYEFIPTGGMNDVIKEWQSKQADRIVTGATPSSITKCPRAVWLENQGVEAINEMTWAVKQRLMLGRELENMFATQLADEGMLLFHWKDDPGVEVKRFAWGEGDDHIDGVPDYLLKLKDDTIVVSDAKTSRSDSFGYVEIDAPDIWTDWGWYKYRLQLTAYFMLCHANKEWFESKGLPLPTHCHLFSYALDDGVVRREITWQPSKADMEQVVKFARRFNKAFASQECPPCYCADSFDQFDVKFCKYGIKPEGSKIATSCCGDELIP
jgi:hypothetical protein